MAEKRYLMRDVLKLLKVCRKTYFNWERDGKIPKAKKEPMSGYRYWTESDLERLRKITGR